MWALLCCRLCFLGMCLVTGQTCFDLDRTFSQCLTLKPIELECLGARSVKTQDL